MPDYEYVHYGDEPEYLPEPEENKVEDPKDERPNRKEAFLGLLIGLGYLTIFATIFLYIIIIFRGNPYTDAESAIMSSTAQLISAAVSIIGMFFISRRVIKQIKEGFNLKALARGLLYAVILYIAAIITNIVMTMILGGAETNANQSSINELMVASPVLGFIFVVVAAPIIEELIFRYYLFGAISKKSVILAFLASSIGFGLIHMISSFANYAAGGALSELLNDLKTLPDYIVAGALFSFFYYKRKHISYTIFAHMIYNCFVTLIMLSSIRNSPLLIKNVKTTEDSISFNLTVLENTTVNKIELYEYKDGKATTLIMELPVPTDNNYNNLEFETLPNQTVYEIKVTYQYDTVVLDTETFQPKTETLEGSLTTHAKTRG